jgi:hypothetical protein
MLRGTPTPGENERAVQAKLRDRSLQGWTGARARRTSVTWPAQQGAPLGVVSGAATRVVDLIDEQARVRFSPGSTSTGPSAPHACGRTRRPPSRPR